MRNFISVALCNIAITMLCSNLMYGQCSSDSHSINIADAWVSCQESIPPYIKRPSRHWIMYDLGYVYDLGPMTVWNYNVKGQLKKGFKKVFVDYSVDGLRWRHAGKFKLPKAPGKTSYQGHEGIDLSGITARYVLLYAKSTYGHANCAGLSEVKIELNGSNFNSLELNYDSNLSMRSTPSSLNLSLFPNPVTEVLNISFETETKREIVITNETGHEMKRLSSSEKMIYTDVSFYVPGIYFLSVVNTDGERVIKKFIKIK